MEKRKIKRALPCPARRQQFRHVGFLRYTHIGILHRGKIGKVCPARVLVQIDDFAGYMDSSRLRIKKWVRHYSTGTTLFCQQRALLCLSFVAIQQSKCRKGFCIGFHPFVGLEALFYCLLAQHRIATLCQGRQVGLRIRMIAGFQRASQFQ